MFSIGEEVQGFHIEDQLATTSEVLQAGVPRSSTFLATKGGERFILKQYEGRRARGDRNRLAKTLKKSTSVKGLPRFVDQFGAMRHNFYALVASFIEGETFPLTLQGTDFDLGRSLAVLDDVHTQVEGLHEAGIVHLDVQGGNIIYNGSGYLIDLEMATDRGAKLNTFQRENLWAKCPDYKGVRRPRADPAIDAYLLARTLEVQLGATCMGNEKYEGQFLEASGQLDDAIKDETQPLRDFFQRALAKDPAHRHGSLAEQQRHLQDLRENGRVQRLCEYLQTYCPTG